MIKPSVTGLPAFGGVATSRGVDVASPIGGQAVVGPIVQPAKRQGGTVLIALRGVIEDDIEQDFDSGAMEGVDHGAELGHLAHRSARPRLRGVRLIRREVADGVVAPVVGKPPFDEKLLGYGGVDREEFDCGHAQIDQMRERAS